MRFMSCFTLLLLLATTPAQAQDMNSGPDRGVKLPALKVFDVTGQHMKKEVDYVADRKDRATVYLFVQADRFDRPMNRFMKTLDTAIKKDVPEGYVVAVWLTGDADKTRAYLPRVQQSVRYEVTALTCAGMAEGPKGWGINSDAHVTAVLANKGRVVASFGYQSINETNVPMVMKVLKAAASPR